MKKREDKKIIKKNNKRNVTKNMNHLMTVLLKRMATCPLSQIREVSTVASLQSPVVFL